jgi:CRISPR-associated protein Cmr3
MRIFIEPTEPLLFRTGRSFDAGESNFAETIFPPTPETIQGAIRAMIAAHTSLVDITMSIAARFGTATLTNLIGDRSHYGRFRITGLALGKYTKEDGLVRLFPAPASLIKVRFRGDKDPTIAQLKLQELPGVINDRLDTMQYLTPPDFDERGEVEGKPKAAGWLTEQSLRLALDTHLDFLSIKSEDEFYTLEPRLGIGMQNETKTTRTGYLYQVQMIRVHATYGFVIDIRLSEGNNPGRFTDDSKTQADLGLPDTGWLILGGEQRAAHFTILGTAPQEESVGAQKPGKRVYLATPAYFSRGWQPPGERFTPDHKLIAAAVNKPESIGGWSLNPNNAGGNSKTTRRCIPAGSVYYFDKPVSIMQPLTEYGWQIGYGIAYTGDYES